MNGSSTGVIVFYVCRDSYSPCLLASQSYAHPKHPRLFYSMTLLVGLPFRLLGMCLDF